MMHVLSPQMLGIICDYPIVVFFLFVIFDTVPLWI